MEFDKSEVERKGLIFVGFFILQYAKLRTLELYHNFFDKHCDVTKFEELEMDTDSLYPALFGHELYECIPPARKKECNFFGSGDCNDGFSDNSTTNFSPRTCCAKHKKHDRGEPGLFKEDSVVEKWFVCVAKHIVDMTHSQAKSILAARPWLMERLKTVVIVPCPNIAKF